MKKSELKNIIKECIREEMGTIKEGGWESASKAANGSGSGWESASKAANGSGSGWMSAKQAIVAAEAFAKIEGNSKAMAALKNMNKDPKAFDTIIKKLLSPQEYKAVKELMK